MKNRWLLVGSSALVWVITLSTLGCILKPLVNKQPSSIKIAVEGQADPTANRDVNGDPNSVVIRIYHLKGTAEFNKLTFDMVTSGRPDQELLGPDYLGRSQVVAVPGTTNLETIDLSPGTRYIGVVGFFRKPDPNYWRYIISVEQLKIARSKKQDWKGKKLPLFSFKVQDCFMTVNYCKPEYLPGQPENAKPECVGYFTSSPTTAPPAKTPVAPPSVVKPGVPPKPPGT